MLSGNLFMANSYSKVVLPPQGVIGFPIANSHLYPKPSPSILDRITNYISVMSKSHFLIKKLNLMKKFKQLAKLSFLLGSLFLFSATSVNAQYVSDSEAMTILQSELDGLHNQKVSNVMVPSALSETGQNTASGNISVEVRAKKLFYTKLMENIKEGSNGVGPAIAQTYSDLGSIFSGNADRQSILDDTEDAAQDLLQD